MTVGERPGGLTALAVVNFVWGALDLLGALSMGFVILMPQFTGDAAEQMETQGITRGLLILLATQSTAEGVLLVLSGIGYLKRKRVLGRVLASVYAILSLVMTAVALALIGKIGLAQFFGFVYPLLTLYFVNVTFKDDLVL